MAQRYTINMITPDTKDWTCKVQVVDKSRPRDNKDKTIKYQVLVLQDEEENQVQATIFSTDITYFENEFAPFKTYLVSVAHVKLPPLGYENPLNKFVWTLDKNTIVEPVEEVKPPEDPLPPPTRLTLTTFHTFEYQSKEFEFDVLAIVINGSPSTKTATGKRIQEFIVMDKLHPAFNKTLGQDFTIGLVLNKVPIPPHSNNHKSRVLLPGRNLANVPHYLFHVLGSVLKFLCLSSFDLVVCLIESTLRQTLGHPWKNSTKLTLWEDFIDHEGVKLFNQLHDYPIILARRIGKSSSGTSNRFVGLTSKFNTTIEINPPYPQAAELRTWIKTIETKLVAYKMKSTTPIGSIMLIPFEDEVISVANIQAQPPGQVFNVEAELSLASKDQRFSVLACSNFTIKDNSGFATAIVSDEIAEKMLHLTSEEIYEICFMPSSRFNSPSISPIKSAHWLITLEHFCCGSRNGHFLHSFAAAIECRVLQASDVAMWMPSVPLLLWKLKIFSPVLADKACVIVSSHAIAQPFFHHCSGRGECHTVIPSDASFQFCLLSLNKKYELPISA
ncbi:hypothetical protein MTR67_049814 [Solanum verrucosum]|uniref:Uncharacterized protein n=1 Tax=Solanum verrucosum TaxID=315347 RepID=A0AAF0V3C5_SOLVR|nr:hypothetical protein MTR67_049814 [Solanum verrucosum]